MAYNDRLRSHVQTSIDGSGHSTIIPISIRKRTAVLLESLVRADTEMTQFLNLVKILSTKPEDVSRQVAIEIDWTGGKHPDIETELHDTSNPIGAKMRDVKSLFDYITGEYDYRLIGSARDALDALRNYANGFLEFDSHLRELTRRPLPRTRGSMPFERWLDVVFARGLETPIEVEKDLGAFTTEFERTIMRAYGDIVPYRLDYYVTTPYYDLYAYYLSAREAKKSLRWILRRSNLLDVLERAEKVVSFNNFNNMERRIYPRMYTDTKRDEHSLIARDAGIKIRRLLANADKMRTAEVL